MDRYEGMVAAAPIRGTFVLEVVYGRRRGLQHVCWVGSQYRAHIVTIHILDRSSPCSRRTVVGRLPLE